MWINTGVLVSKFGYRGASDKICSDSESLKGGSWYMNSDKNYQNLDTEAPQYPNRGGSRYLN